MTENDTVDLDDKGRVILRSREEDGLIQEWTYKYDENGKQIETSYFEEVSNAGELYSNYC
tara:strand:- start:495 stop:674 length:180 start_codon:yes stop_codon:yes gene_type:complete